MLHLGDDVVADTDVVRALTSSNVEYTSRFEVVERGQIVGDLGNAVTQASVAHDTTKAVKRTLSLKLVADTMSDMQPMVTCVRPYSGVKVGGYVREWPMGLFTWSLPSWTPSSRFVREYEVTLQDYVLWRLAAERPTDGYVIPDGMYVSEAVTNILHNLGITDISIPGSTITTSGLKYDGGRTTWLGALNEMCASAGWYPLWTDGYGITRTMPVADLATAEPGWSYVTDQQSIIIDSLKMSTDLSKLANRIRVTSTSLENNENKIYSAEAVAPANHPFSVENIGFWIDRPPIQEQNVSDHGALQTRANNELQAALQVSRSVSVPTRGNPTHDSYDVVRVLYTGDEELGDGPVFYETAWGLDLTTFEMDHTLNRILDRDVEGAS